MQDGQDRAQEVRILPKRINLAPDLAQDLRQDPGQDFARHNLGILDKILGKSWARSLAQELFAENSYLSHNGNFFQGFLF